jgi:predicted nuclease with TOPRIM domain
MEIETLKSKMIFYETFKHKFDVKSMETERLLSRVEELSQVNGGLEDSINKQKAKNYKLMKRIEDLREKLK